MCAGHISQCCELVIQASYLGLQNLIISCLHNYWDGGVFQITFSHDSGTCPICLHVPSAGENLK